MFALLFKILGIKTKARTRNNITEFLNHTVRGQIKQRDLWHYGLNKWSQLVKELEKVEPKSSAFLVNVFYAWAW